MKTLRIRSLGMSMVAAAVFGILMAHATVSPTPVAAAPCCQECEAQEAACYASCNEQEHGLDENDTLQACNNGCYYELYEDEPYACWQICRLCSQGPSPGLAIRT